MGSVGGVPVPSVLGGGLLAAAVWEGGAVRRPSGDPVRGKAEKAKGQGGGAWCVCRPGLFAVGVCGGVWRGVGRCFRQCGGGSFCRLPEGSDSLPDRYMAYAV